MTNKNDQSLHVRLDESQATLQMERARQESHIQAVEGRAHREIDRARQDARQWQQRHEKAERAHRESIAVMQN